ncbi:JmjC domain, hydroxylase-domain-containing protein [Gorgonomyces haynaldii]|nr:JmjC domain, hydroxylase-domain-containing protein [Gorgonomyces haynaldii]
MKRLKLSNYEQKQQQRLDLSTVKTTPQQQETKAFYPTDKEFTDPLKYIQQIKNQAEMDGICKIVPPSGWKPGFALDTTAFQFETRLQHLNMMSAASRLTNNYCEQLAKYHCSMGNDIQKIPQLEGGPINFYALHTVIKRKGGFEALEDWDPVCEYLELAPNKRNASRLKQVYEKYILPFENFQNTFVSVLGKRKSNDCHQCHKTVTNGIHCADCEQIYHIQCTRYGQMLEEWYCDDCILKTPDEYEFEDGPVYGLKDFQAECEKFKNRFFRKSQVSEQECEEAFWDLLDSPFEDVQVEYGADLHTSEHGSGFPDKKKTPDAPYADHPWNLNNIARLPGSLLSQINKEIPGMTVPWIYIGSCFSTFCWHAEDHFTYSINYHHFGETKTWYGIPAADAEKFDRLMQKECPELFKKSPDLLFHITTMLDPALLRENGIRVVKIHQRPREFVVTFPRAYHAGFNQGFNCAEAVNFALPDWLPFGSLCCSLYTQHKKLPVFCHEELIMSLCQAPKISHCSWLYDQISDLIARETKQRESLMVKFPDLQPVYTQSESVQCSYCHCYCYISWLEDDDVYCLSCLVCHLI